ncbi:MAG: flagellar biosynthesis anti-sigma factor FlgM [Chitinispirillaceae bacterium]
MNIQSVSTAYKVSSFAFRGENRGKADKRKAVSFEERVEISDELKSVRELGEKVDIMPEVREDKIRQARDKIYYHGYPLESDLVEAIEKLIERGITLFGE